MSTEHGYDTKYAMHCLRIGHQGIELMETGTISLPVTEPTRSRLREVRGGSVPKAEVLEEIGHITERLERATGAAELPPEPDWGRIDGFLADAYERHWDLRDANERRG